MMLRSHHLGLTMMCYRYVGIPSVEPSLMDEWASQNSRNRTGCVKEEILQPFPVAAAVLVEQVDVLEKLVERLRTVVAVLRCHQ